MSSVTELVRPLAPKCNCAKMRLDLGFMTDIGTNT